MAMIKDVELGWLVDEDYYVYYANSVLSTHSGTLKKANDGGAIGIECHYINSNNQEWYGPIIFSNVERYAMYTPGGQTLTFTIDNKRWYASLPEYWTPSAAADATLPDFDLNDAGIDQSVLDTMGEPESMAIIAQHVIEAVGLTFHEYVEASSPTYVKNFVKRALIKNNEHIVALIPDLEYDEEPTEDSDNLLTSGTIYEALENVEVTVDSSPTSGSNNPVSSDGVYDAMKKQLFTGTHAEVEAAILNGTIEDGTTILYTDDTVDAVPTANSQNFVPSGGIYSALQKLVFVGTHAQVDAALANEEIDDGTVVVYTDDTDIDTTPTENSNNPITSGGVYTAINNLEMPPDIYSTTETKTNKIWIDGKPIYRKCFTGTEMGLRQGWVTVTWADVDGLNIDNIVYSYIRGRDSDPVYNNLSYPVGISTSENDTYLHIVPIYNIIFFDTVVIEYTKTTD